MHAGDVAPDFELPDENGDPRSLRELLEAGPVVLFFYPAALTAGCTAESCHFRDLSAEFTTVGAQRVGVSADSIDRQKQFRDKHLFDFPLLSDPDGRVARQYGVQRALKPLTAIAPVRRQTFVIDTDRRILNVIKSEVRMSAHADRALATLREHTRT